MIPVMVFPIAVHSTTVQSTPAEIPLKPFPVAVQWVTRPP